MSRKNTTSKSVQPRLVIATHNLGKYAEMQDHPWLTGFALSSLAELGIPDIEETGDSFVANALLKARHAAKYTGYPVIADDSGLSVDALAGAPGIYSSRYAGPNASNIDRINKLLTALRGVPPARRTAHYHCTLVYLGGPNDAAPLVCEAQWPGVILEEMRGGKGFGYDPIFYIPAEGCTAAELPEAVKKRISHRGQALDQLASLHTR